MGFENCCCGMTPKQPLETNTWNAFDEWMPPPDGSQGLDGT